MGKTILHGLTTDLPGGIDLMDGTVKRNAIKTDGALVVFNHITPEMPDSDTHDHPFDQLALIFGAPLEFVLDGTPYVVEDGGYLYIPAGVPHSGKLADKSEKKASLNIDIFSPPREDYLFLVENQPK